MKCSPENRVLELFCRLAVINQPPLGLLPPGVLELLNYQAEVGELYYLRSPVSISHLYSPPALSEGRCK